MYRNAQTGRIMLLCQQGVVALVPHCRRMPVFWFQRLRPGGRAQRQAGRHDLLLLMERTLKTMYGHPISVVEVVSCS